MLLIAGIVVVVWAAVDLWLVGLVNHHSYWRWER